MKLVGIAHSTPQPSPVLPSASIAPPWRAIVRTVNPVRTGNACSAQSKLAVAKSVMSSVVNDPANEDWWGKLDHEAIYAGSRNEYVAEQIRQARRLIQRYRAKDFQNKAQISKSQSTGVADAVQTFEMAAKDHLVGFPFDVIDILHDSLEADIANMMLGA